MKDVNLIILAGGDSRRMKFPKEFLKIDGEYLIHKNIRILKNIFDEIIVVSNEKSHYENLDVKVVRDIFYKKGPLAGLHSGLTYSSKKFSYLLACDMPIVDLNFVKFVISNIDTKFDGVVFEDENKKILPMNGIYKNELKTLLKEELLKNNLKFTNFINKNNFKILPYEKIKKFYKDGVFLNLNTQKDLEKLKQNEQNSF